MAKVVLDAGQVHSSHLSSADGQRAGVDKQQHIVIKETNFGLVIGGTPVNDERIVFQAKTAGTFKSFEATLNDTGTTTAVTFDCLKNGVSILSAAVSFTHADSDKTSKSGTITTTTFVAGDIISLKLVQTDNTGAQGPVASIEMEITAS